MSTDREQRHAGQLDKALDAAKANGWTVVDMKNDWKRNLRRSEWRPPRLEEDDDDQAEDATALPPVLEQPEEPPPGFGGGGAAPSQGSLHRAVRASPSPVMPSTAWMRAVRCAVRLSVQVSGPRSWVKLIIRWKLPVVVTRGEAEAVGDHVGAGVESGPSGSLAEAPEVRRAFCG